jgi:hypothetical protein
MSNLKIEAKGKVKVMKTASELYLEVDSALNDLKDKVYNGESIYCSDVVDLHLLVASMYDSFIKETTND